MESFDKEPKCLIIIVTLFGVDIVTKDSLITLHLREIRKLYSFGLIQKGLKRSSYRHQSNKNNCIQGSRYSRICRNRRKTYAISRILAQILPVPISPNVPISLKIPNIAEFF
jgi:hypothetical protein